MRTTTELLIPLFLDQEASDPPKRKFLSYIKILIVLDPYLALTGRLVSIELKLFISDKSDLIIAYTEILVRKLYNIKQS